MVSKSEKSTGKVSEDKKVQIRNAELWIRDYIEEMSLRRKCMIALREQRVISSITFVKHWELYARII